MEMRSGMNCPKCGHALLIERVEPYARSSYFAYCGDCEWVWEPAPGTRLAFEAAPAILRSLATVVAKRMRRAAMDQERRAVA